VISDVRLPDLSGEDVFARARAEGCAPPYLFITAYGSVERAVGLLKQGAVDYVTKPFDIAELVGKVRALVGAEAPAAELPADSPLGVSPAMRALAAAAPRIAARARKVLIVGESGCGKEVLARHLHALAARDGSAPFVAVNCGAIPEPLLEAAFFGHERGAFTGADRPRRGYFEQAHGGTLFLDEIAELPPLMQVKLLRAIQERAVQRLGSETVIPVDARVICATHRDLRAEVAAGRFREDLYYRINVVQLVIPPLRERVEDVLWLARRFLEAQAARLGEPPRSLSAAARARLLAHDWPGNVRELLNRIERACVVSERAVLEPADLFGADMPGDAGAVAGGGLLPLDRYLAEAEREYIASALARFNGRITATAAALGVSRKTLWEKMKRHRLHAGEADARESEASATRD
ncbi:MAG: sigma-54 dependent transcriptional regulator, partial [Burkholderiaceae bacterium]|nr:sigma-54 dependent transcriptional regulator [Burkholderiaceae bacterium]